MDKRVFHITCVVGTRPNFIKMAPVIRALEEHGSFSPVLVHTGQHHDALLSDPFFEELGLPKPIDHMGAGSGSHAGQFARIMPAFSRILENMPTDAVLVAGDVNSTLACALTAVKMSIPVVHLEAGLRSGDRKMPEEINRLMTDAISSLLLVPSTDGMDHLMEENIPEKKLALVGNVMIDTLRLQEGRINTALLPEGIIPGDQKYALLTLHRPGNVDDDVVLERIMKAMIEVSKDLPVIFPLHPRTRQALEKADLFELLSKIPGLVLSPPLSYLQFSRLLKNAALVFTDSGGIQEESTVWGVPCITLRENTERPVTVSIGTNVLAGSDPEKILFLSKQAVAGSWKTSKIPELWDGKTSQRIASRLFQFLSDQQ